MEDVKKIKKEKMSQDQAFNLIDEWIDFWEVGLKEEDLEDIKYEIWKSVQMERLTFNDVDETFVYKLKKPICDLNGNVKYSLIKLQESEMEKKKGASKHKDDIDKVASWFKSYITDMEGNEIQHGFLTRIKDRDQKVISAIILSFFVQAVPGQAVQK